MLYNPQIPKSYFGNWLADIGTALVHGGASAISQHQTNQTNRDISNDQMRFQERMSSTSHQREVSDLKAAGLNPILSAHGGAPGASGAGAVMQNPLEDVSANINSAISTARELELAASTVKKQNAETEYTKSLKKKADVDAEVSKRHLPEADARNKIYDRIIGPVVDKITGGVSSAAKQLNDRREEVQQNARESAKKEINFKR